MPPRYMTTMTKRNVRITGLRGASQPPQSNTVRPMCRLEPGSRQREPASGAELDPPPDPPRIGVIRLAELAAHLLLLERDMDPIGGREDRDRGQEHRPGADPDRDPQTEDHQAEIHRV